MKGFEDKTMRFRIIGTIKTKGYLHLYGHCQCTAYGLQWRFRVVFAKYTQKYSSEYPPFPFLSPTGRQTFAWFACPDPKPLDRSCQWVIQISFSYNNYFKGLL